ncbi:MAG: hypothetical protein J6D37_06395 [Clostridia bacterium]|nr:hypothetical protein [Clostridia bacterium]
MTNPIYDPYQVLFPIYSAGTHLKQALSSAMIEEVNRAKTVKTVYGVLEEDGYLSLCIKTFAPKAPKLPIRVILKIALYHILFLKKSRYAVTDFAVELVKKLGKGGAAGFVNAFLRGFDESKVVLPKGDEGLAVRYGFPLFAVQKIRREYGERTTSILSARSAGVTVRFAKNEEAYLSAKHTDMPFPHTYLFERFAREEGFSRGDYTFQSIGSIAICDIVPPCASLLDACAAPGGKSVLLADKCEKVTSFELYPHRVALIESYASRMGKTLTIVQKDSSVYDERYRESFDGVLCDVPCSGLGTVAENPDLKLNKTEEDFRKLKEVQTAILHTCSRYLKKGGALVYSTCSLLREENDDIVRTLIEEGWTADEIDSPLPHEKKEYGLQFLPDKAFGAGFYVARLRHGKD